MITRIEVISKFTDARAKVKKRKIENFGFKEKIENVWVIDVYTIEKQLKKNQLEKVADALTNPVSQISFINKSIPNVKFNFAIETGFLPGVTDNIANSARELIEDLLKIKFAQNEGVYSSQLLLVKGKLSEKDTEKIAKLLINPLIQRVHIKNFINFNKSRGMDKIVPKVKLDEKIKIDNVNLDVSDEELIKIGKLGIQSKDGSRRGPLALDLTYMKAIQEYFKKKKRNPTDIELESIAQTWSEHCKHTIFADPIDDIKVGLFNAFIKKSTDEIRAKKKSKGRDFCVSVFKDNSGAIEFDDKYLITHKVETHNSPSALDPFGGAITGIVGVNRDTIGFGMGAKPILNTYGYCFADPNTKKELFRNPQLTEKLLSPRRILDGVIEGVNSGGNCSGIPTPQGFVFFNEKYQGKPLVFVGTLGLIPKKTGQRKNYIKKAKNGDYIVMVGGRVGQDGIHGATFSSEALNQGSPAGAVQIGDPITQKKLSDAIVKEARDLNLFDSITDNGAGGISCSIAEMAKETNGCEVWLDKVPLKYPGLEPWKIWISESQERMTLAVPKNKWKKFQNLMKRRGVEATVIGKFLSSGKCIVKHKNKTVMSVDMDFLHYGLPKRPMKTQKLEVSYKPYKQREKKDLTGELLKMIQRPNISSFEFISQQYDHEVQGNSILKPIVGKGRVSSEVSLIRPLFDSKKGVVISQGLYPTYSDLNPYNMAASSIDTAVRNIVAAGADLKKIALLDNFCWCSPNEPQRLWQLKEAARACYELSTFFETPFISGKDSMHNDFKGFNQKGREIKISIPPTLLISSIGVIDDVSNSISIDAKFPNDFIYLLGETKNEMGGSEYFEMLKITDKNVPRVDVKSNKKLYEDFYRCTKNNLISSSISVNRGGVGVALLKMSMAGMLGAEVSLENLKNRLDDFINLFSESQGRILVTLSPKNKAFFEKMMKGNSVYLLGKVTKNKAIDIKGVSGKIIAKTNLENVLKAYKKTFKDY